MNPMSRVLKMCHFLLDAPAIWAPTIPQNKSIQQILAESCYPGVIFRAKKDGNFCCFLVAR